MFFTHFEVLPTLPVNNLHKNPLILFAFKFPNCSFFQHFKEYQRRVNQDGTAASQKCLHVWVRHRNLVCSSKHCQLKELKELVLYTSFGNSFFLTFSVILQIGYQTLAIRVNTETRLPMKRNNWCALWLINGDTSFTRK